MNGISSQLPVVSADLAVPSRMPGRGSRAAREFEAQLIGSLLQSLEKTFAALPGQDDMAGADNYGYLGTQALAGALAERGGFGIASMITEDLAKHQGK